MLINASYDASVTGNSNAAKIEGAITAAIQYLESVITNNITININFGFGEINGKPLTGAGTSIGRSEYNGNNFTYQQMKSQLSAAKISADDTTALNTLPSGDPTNGGTFFETTAQQKALGLAPTQSIDGWVGLNSSDTYTFDPNNRAVSGANDAIGVLEHEITEVMGRFGDLGRSNVYSILDLFRYASAGTRQLVFGPGYFSVDGQTLLTQYNNPNNGGDAADWLPSIHGDSFGDNYTGIASLVTETDLREMDVIGYARSGQVSPPGNFLVTDNTTMTSIQDAGTAYSGPVTGLQYQYINISPDNLNVTAQVANSFIHTGSGFDAIDVSHVGGTNVLDGGTNSNFLVGGTGAASNDTFFVDDRGPYSDIWSTVANFHVGDAATIFGVTQQGFQTTWVDGQGAAGFTGLTLHETAPGVPTASLTLSGYTTADLSNGRLTTTFGTEADGTPYLYVHGNS